ncbi:MAG TPA: anthranilate synthase component I [Terriglobales bacterium]|nr:anthranilate synthase component I [Terriglobales bacterium]
MPDSTQPLPLAEVRRLAADYNLVPLARTILADLNTPVAAYLNCLRGRRSKYSYLLESVEGGEKLGRYSYLGVDPDFLLRQRNGKVSLRRQGAGKWEAVAGSLSHLAREEARRRRVAPMPDLPPFLAGAVGYMGYDMVRSFERIPTQAKNDLGLDEGLLMFFSRQIVFDHVRRQITLVACVDTAAAAGIEAEFARALADIEAMAARLEHAPPRPRSTTESGPMPVFPNWERTQFETAVRRAKQYIEAGDVFQVVLSQRFDVATEVAPFQVYRALRTINPSPYMFFLQLGDWSVAGASPELLVGVAQRQIQYRPIAGTRARGASEDQDAELTRELLADEKERAEHVMLVDLGRNDVGRVATVGTVTVPALMTVEKYSHVQHLVSDVRAELRAGCDAFDALTACFPAGTLSGAPKVRAMQIIEELEPTRRGPYGGTVLNFDYSGNLSSCILIRAVVFRKGMASVQAGAGIVADSVPEREFLECVNKAGAMMRAIERARAGL